MAYFFDILTSLVSANPTPTQRQPNANTNYRISIELYSFGRNVSSVLSASK